MNLSDSKKKLVLAGVVCGIVAACLATLGNPANMAFCTWGIYHFNSNKRISLNGGIIADDPFYSWCDHYDRCTCIPGMPSAYGNPYVGR